MKRTIRPGLQVFLVLCLLGIGWRSASSVSGANRPPNWYTLRLLLGAEVNHSPTLVSCQNLGPSEFHAPAELESQPPLKFDHLRVLVAIHHKIGRHLEIKLVRKNPHSFYTVWDWVIPAHWIIGHAAVYSPEIQPGHYTIQSKGQGPEESCKFYATLEGHG